MDMSLADGQGGLACWDSWGHKESDTTERLNLTKMGKKLMEKPDLTQINRNYEQ